MSSNITIIWCMFLVVGYYFRIGVQSFVLLPSSLQGCYDYPNIQLCASSSSLDEEKPKPSAFGKAAIGRRPPSRKGKNRKSKTSVDIGSTSTSTSEGSENVELMKKRDLALIALQTNLKKYITLEECLEFLNLNANPILYRDLPSKLLYLLQEVNVSPKRIAQMLKQHPLLLKEVFLEDDLKSTMEILQTELQITSPETLLKLCEKLPSLLTYHRSELRQRILVYKNQLDYSIDDLQQLVLRDPRILRTPFSNVRQIIIMLEEELNISSSDIQSMLKKEPLVLTYNAETNLRRTIHFLKESPIGTCVTLSPPTPREKKNLQIIIEGEKEEDDGTDEIDIAKLRDLRLKKLIMGHPKILSSSIENNLQPKVEFFLRELLVTPTEFGRLMLRRGGSLLEANLQRTLKTKIDFLRTNLALSLTDSDDYTTTTPIRNDDIDVIVEIPNPNDSHVVLTDFQKRRLLAQMLAINPDILTLSIESNLQPKFDFLYKTLDISQSQARFLTLKRPQLFSLSLENNLRPKIQYLQTYSSTKEEFKDWMVSNPASLATVFDKRIKPRVQQLIEDLNYTTILHPNIPPNFLTLAESSWNKWVINGHHE